MYKGAIYRVKEKDTVDKMNVSKEGEIIEIMEEHEDAKYKVTRLGSTPPEVWIVQYRFIRDCCEGIDTIDSISRVPGAKGWVPDKLSEEDGYRAFKILKGLI